MTEKTKLASIFYEVKKRCTNPRSQAYKNYGGRGIVVEWKNAKEFYRDMKDGYRQGLTLDRINNNGNYSKANCRWATWKEQNNNRRTNRIILYKGQKKTMAEWIEKLGLKSSTVRQRYNIYGWSVERSFEEATQTKKEK